MNAAKLAFVGLLAALVGAPPLVTAQAGKKEAAALDWNQFRGPNRDAHSADTGLLQEWPKEGPPLAWKVSGLGVGFSSVAVTGNHAFTCGEVDKKAILYAINVPDGKILWKLPFGGAVTDGQGGPGPRSTPATDGTLVFAIGGSGEIVCARVADGKVVWQKNMKDFGGGEGGWHFSESPLLDGNSLVISPGGTVTALAKATGAPMWKSKKIKWDNNTYTSIGIAEIGKVRQYLVMSMNAVAGITRPPERQCR